MEAVTEGIAAELPPSQAAAAYALLIKIINNVLKATPGTPESAKVRTLKKDGKAISETLATESCLTLLVFCGFEDTGTTYHLREGEEDREVLETAVALLEALHASVEAPVSAAAPIVAPASEVAPALSATSHPASASSANAGVSTRPTNSRDFARRDDAEARRQAAQDELIAMRAEQKAQRANATAEAYAAAPASPAASASKAASSASQARDADKKHVKSAFDFESRSKKDAAAAAALQNQQDLRALQKQKYNEFKADPTAQQSQAYKAPPTVAAGGKTEDGWFGGWFSGWGGSSSSSGGGGYGGSGGKDDGKPRMKTINDLPKPVQRG